MHDLDLVLYSGPMSNVNVAFEIPYMTLFVMTIVAIVMLSLCHHFRDRLIRIRPVQDLDRYNLPRSNVDVPIVSQYKTLYLVVIIMFPG